MNKTAEQIPRQILVRNFSGKMPGIMAGTTTAFVHRMNPQPPEGYEYRGKAFNGEEIFSNGDGAYFFPKRICTAGEIVYIREEWAIQYADDGSPSFAYKAGWEGKDRALWKSATYMPMEAARFFLLVESTEICRIADIPAKTAKDLGFPGRSWRKDLEAAWKKDLRGKDKTTLAFDNNPWVQVVHFRRVPIPDGWPTEITTRIMAHGSHKSYTIRLAETGAVVAKGNAAECAKAMGYKGPSGIYTLIKRVSSGESRKYTIEEPQEPRDRE